MVEIGSWAVGDKWETVSISGCDCGLGGMVGIGGRVYLCRHLGREAVVGERVKLELVFIES